MAVVKLIYKKEINSTTTGSSRPKLKTGRLNSDTALVEILPRALSFIGY